MKARLAHSLLMFLTILICAWAVVGCSSMTPAQYTREKAPKGCDFNTGVAHGADRIVYDNLCPMDKEKIYLVGYGIGRKIHWVDGDIETQEKYTNCLMRLREHGVGYGVSVSVSQSNSPSKNEDETPFCAAKKLEWRTDSSLEKEVVEEQKLLADLKEKRARLETLRSKIAAKPAQAEELVTEYEKSGVDKLDVGLRWNKYIAQQGGIDKLTMTEKYQMRLEMDTMLPPPSDVSRGALFYGFGIGHARQGRFASVGWIYAVIDSLLIGAAGYGLGTNQPGIWGAALVLGLPASHFVQYVGVYNHDFDHSLQMQNLRTERIAGPRTLALAWLW